jgi:DNA (cytosine-5)-methyltransferase 3A
MKVLSLFDGISCGRVALDRAKIPVDKYYAYEIEPSAIKISKKNYPDIIHGGDVFNTDFSEYEGKGIDLLLGGSPCTFWSKAKCHTAKQAREIDTNGMGWKLFLRYVEALHKAKPKYFIYENNYGMDKTIEDAITAELGVMPILIDSALVSAQKRKRLYWTNIPNVTQPKDKGIKVRDIIVEDQKLIKHFDDRIRRTMIKTENYIKYDLGGKGHYSQQDRLYYLDGKAPTVPKSRTETKFNVWLGGETYKKTCPIEAERLQTLPDNYTEGVPKTKRFEAIGNGWTVDVITHILSFI